MLRKRKKRNNKIKPLSRFFIGKAAKKELSMKRYEEVKMSIVVFENDDAIRMSLGDNEVPEIGGGDEGGIFG